MTILLALVTEHWWWIAGCLFGVLLVVKVLFGVADVLYQTTLPETKFGFRGKLVYSDDSPKAKVFVNHRYQLSAKPDFVFRTGLFEYTMVEYKSREGRVKSSDIIQVKASIIAVRSKYNITNVYIVTGQRIQQVKALSNFRLYRDIKKLHKLAKRVKFLNKKPNRLENSDKCNRCGYREHCLSLSD